jgi:hypothetical protein
MVATPDRNGDAVVVSYDRLRIIVFFLLGNAVRSRHRPLRKGSLRSDIVLSVAASEEMSKIDHFE